MTFSTQAREPVSGLLHDAGTAALASHCPREYRQALGVAVDGQVDQLGAEQQAFGANHADVGGYLLGLWGLPVAVVEAIARHHQPGLAPDQTFTARTAVHVANTLIHAGDNPQCPPAVDRPCSLRWAWAIGSMSGNASYRAFLAKRSRR